MNCLKCGKEMRKVRWEITNNFKTGKDFKEYDKVTYECRGDDIWVTTEIPMGEGSKDEVAASDSQTAVEATGPRIVLSRMTGNF